jgi:hypothetical protein
MVKEVMMTKLYKMKLSALVIFYRQQMEDPAVNKLSFDERFGLLVDAGWTTRKNNRLKRPIYRADFPMASVYVWICRTNPTIAFPIFRRSLAAHISSLKCYRKTKD